VISTLHTTDARKPFIVSSICTAGPAAASKDAAIPGAGGGTITSSLAARRRKGRIAAFEIMLATSAVRNLIREGKVSDLNNIIQLSPGMV